MNPIKLTDFELHLVAGLTWTGLNADDEDEFIGSKKQWEKYQKISNEAE